MVDTKYVLIAQGRVISDNKTKIEKTGSIEEMIKYGKQIGLERFLVKPYISHVGQVGENCANCEKKVQENGEGNIYACALPESSNPEVESITYHAAHNSERCCTEHNHHAEFMHVGCYFR